MKYISKYNNFVNESKTTLIKDGPGEQLQTFLDNNLESFVVAMTDDLFKVKLIYNTKDKYSYDMDITKYIPDIKDFESHVESSIRMNRDTNLSSIRRIPHRDDFTGTLGVLFYKVIKFDQLPIKKRLTVKQKEEEIKKIFRKFDNDAIKEMKRYIKFSDSYEYQRTSFIDSGYMKLEYYLYPKDIS